MQSRSIRMDLGEKVSRLEGPVTIYQGEMLILADSATYDWQKQSVQAHGVKAKMQGLIVRSDRADFTTLPDKRQRVSFLDTFVPRLQRPLHDEKFVVQCLKVEIGIGDFGYQGYP